MKNTLYFGDNLQILRQYIPDECVDLVYLDPPFNSSRSYNILFKETTGEESHAQITAFEDTWSWGDESAQTLVELPEYAPHNVVKIVNALVDGLRRSPVTAYLVMMAARLVELHRVLKQTGSLYLHCDPTASHYLKIILDAIFDPVYFRNEIIWRRTNVHSDSKTWSRVSDSLLFYTRGGEYVWNPPYSPHSEQHIESKYRNREPDGRLYTLSDMTSPNPRPNMMYEWKGLSSPPKGWRYSRETITQLDSEGRIWYPDSKSKRPRLKRYLDEMSGTLVGNIWTDINPINSQAAERLGYPTQKPLALLERIIEASSNPGDVVLDPFCGCGTAIHAAQKLGRTWIGIDITHLAISLIKYRLKDAFGDIGYELVGEPVNVSGAEELANQSRYQFEWWALSLVKAKPFQGKAKKADTGIDGLIYIADDPKQPVTKSIIVQVKSGKVDVRAIRELCAVVDREKAIMGLLITLHSPTAPMTAEAIGAGFTRLRLVRNTQRFRY